MGWYDVGRKVEIAGLAEEGFAESWAPATVVEVQENPSKSVIPNLVLHYDEVRACLQERSQGRRCT